MGPSEGSFWDRHVKNASQGKLMLYGILLVVIVVVLILILALTSSSSDETPARKIPGHEILLTTPLVDGSNYLPTLLDDKFNCYVGNSSFNKGFEAADNDWKTDLPRLRSGTVGTQAWTVKVGCDAEFKDIVSRILKQVDAVKKLTYFLRDSLQFVTSADGIKDALNNKKVGNVIGINGAYAIDNQLAVLRTYYDIGVRYFTLALNTLDPTCNILWDQSPDDKTQPYFKKSLVTEMNRLGMIIDLAYSSYDEQKEILGITKAPVIFSSTAAESVTKNPSHVKDDILESIKANKGLVMISFNAEDFPTKGSTDEPTIQNVIDNINYIKHNYGAEYVGIGSGFHRTDKTVKGLEDSSKYPALFDSLASANNTEVWSEKELRLLAGDNFYRVLKAVEKVKQDMLLEQPSEDTVPTNTVAEEDKKCYTKI